MPIWLAIILCAIMPSAGPRPTVLIVVGAPGTPEYASEFRRWAGLWESAARTARAESIMIGQAATTDLSDRDRLRAVLAEQAAAGGEPLWIVLIGHGTYDGRDAKFNLRGPDVTDLELSQWLATVKRPVAVIDCTSASGTFLPKLSGSNRIVVTATRSGSEQNFARFGQYLAESIADPRADLDKDGQVSLLEAFLTAAARVNEYYKGRSQLSTEHALIDDNGDKLGTPADWFRGVRATRKAKDGATADGLRAHQLHLILSDRERTIPPEIRSKRDQLELAVAALREKKAKLAEADYYAQLEPLMLQLAELYRSVASGSH